MFEWLRRKLGKSRAKDTEAKTLKAEIEEKVAKCKERAAKGDSDATLRLGAFQKKVAEQSDRLFKRTGIIAVLMVLALASGGCGGGLGAKTAKDIETAMEDPILPEYLAYVEADPKLKDQDRRDRKQKVQALRFVIKAAQK